MCGRYTISIPFEELIIRFLVEESTLSKYMPKYNAAPMQYIPAVIGSKSGNRLGELRWAWFLPGPMMTKSEVR